MIQTKGSPLIKEKLEEVLASFIKTQTNLVIEVIPDLKVIAQDAISIGKSVHDFRSNREAWESFGEYVQTAVLQVLQSVDSSLVLPLVGPSRVSVDPNINSTAEGDSRQNVVKATQFVCNLLKLHKALSEVHDKIADIHAQPFWTRATKFYQDPGLIDNLRRSIGDVLALFQLRAVTQMGLSLDQVVMDVQRGLQLAEELADKMREHGRHTRNSALDRLPYAEKSSWDGSKICLPETRQKTLDTIEEWINHRGNNASTHAEVMVLSGVVGSGKSTIMQTIAQRCAVLGILGSAFFFNRAIDCRRNISLLFTTMAINICALDQEFEAMIVDSMNKDHGLIAVTPMRQFEELVSKPLSGYKGEKPIVIIIDAIDEGIDIHEPRASPLIDILRDHVQKLPPTVRFLVTYRTHPTLDTYFSNRPHIQTLTINTRDEQSNSDVSRFIDHELRELAWRKRLGNNWPSQQDINQLTQRAEGIFQWAAMACGYLAKSPNPPEDLKRLVGNSALSSESPEAKMNGLYAAVLDSYEWGDPAFLEGINVVLGTILAARTPLSASALHSLHRMSSVPIDEILQQISPLITGWSSENRDRPIHIIHQSLREYLTTDPDKIEDERPSSSTNSGGPNRRFMFEKLRSRELALPCLTIMNEQLSDTTPGAGYIHGTRTYEIPKFPKERISEELRYAVQYWTDHFVEVQAPISASLSMTLLQFFMSNLVTWMEVVCVYGRYPGLRNVINWTMTSIPDRVGIIKNLLNTQVAKSLRMLSQHLAYMDRPDEALDALQDAVNLYQKLEPDSQNGIDEDLSKSMRLLATRLTQAGRDHEAISASEMTLIIDRRLVEQNPSQYMEQLAASLDTYATVMSRAGRTAESLPHMRESVEIYRTLAEKDPGLYRVDMARDLNNLADHLGRMGCYEEAIPMAKEALLAYRYVEQDEPGAYTDHLANALSNCYTLLSSADRNEEALPYMEEAVGIYRRLAKEKPATHTQGLASGLGNYACGLCRLDRRMDALPLMYEAVCLLRVEYTERPAANISKLTSALFYLSSNLTALQRCPEAVQVTWEAIELSKILNEDQLGIHSFTLGTLYTRLHQNYLLLDKPDDAFAAIREAVRYYREMTYTGVGEANPHINLALGLKSLAESYGRMGLEEDYVKVAQEGVEILRIAATAEPDNLYLRDLLGQSLLRWNQHLVRAEEWDGSYICAMESVETYRELARILPSDYTYNLSAAYGRLAISLLGLNRADEAIAAAVEQLSLRQTCAEDDPLNFNSELLDAYVTMMRCLRDIGDEDAMYQVLIDASELYRSILATNPESLTVDQERLFSQLSCP